MGYNSLGDYQMSYSFTITDDYNYPRDEILKWAMNAAQEEIDMRNLDSNLLPQMIDFKEEGGRKTYSFTLLPSKSASLAQKRQSSQTRQHLPPIFTDSP